MKRTMTAQEAQAWVEQAPTEEETWERVEQVQAGFLPEIEDAQLAPNGKPKVQVKLVGEDSNAFAILGRCMKAMRRAGWGTTEIREFEAKATSSDYNHLLATVLEYCEDEDSIEEEEEE
jgi:hypothetical protein